MLHFIYAICQVCNRNKDLLSLFTFLEQNIQTTPLCLFKSLNEFFHMRSDKMAHWSVYEIVEISMLGALSVHFTSLKPLVVYSAKKPILMASYASLAFVTDQLIDVFEGYFYEGCTDAVETIGSQNNHDEQ